VLLSREGRGGGGGERERDVAESYVSVCLLMGPKTPPPPIFPRVAYCTQQDGAHVSSGRPEGVRAILD